MASDGPTTGGHVTLSCDGASTGNAKVGTGAYLRSRAAWAFVAKGQAGMEVFHDAGCIGNGTSQEAEYHAVLRALSWAKRGKYRTVGLRMDCANVAKFVNGINAISWTPHIARLQRRIAELVSCESVPQARSADVTKAHRRRLRLLGGGDGRLVVSDCRWVPESENRQADRLACRQLERAEPGSGGGSTSSSSRSR